MTLEATLQSILAQSYQNWEWVVVNDGSTDKTDLVIHDLIRQYHLENKVIYCYQKNADQLNALIHALEKASGEYCFTLHSDDQLPDENFLQRCVQLMEKNPDIDGLFGDLLLMDEQGNITGRQKVSSYQVSEAMPALTLLWLGRNPYSDVAFHKMSVYRDAVKYNYLTWNMPLWLDTRENKVSMLKYRSVDFPVLKYRIHAGNYVNSALGELNVISGELRTACTLMNYYHIPCYRGQYYLFRVLNKLLPGIKYPVYYIKKPSVNRGKIVSFIIRQRYPKGVDDNLFLAAIQSFYHCNSQRQLKIDYLPEDLGLYYGKDARIFNSMVLKRELPSFYQDFLEEMKQGFKEVVVLSKQDQKKMRVILQLCCIGHVDVKIVNEAN